MAEMEEGVRDSCPRAVLLMRKLAMASHTKH